MKKKFSLSGFPSFNHFQNVKREYITSILKKQFNLFGFSPIKTSCVEKRSNLYGQYHLLNGNEKNIYIYTKSYQDFCRLKIWVRVIS